MNKGTPADPLREAHIREVLVSCGLFEMLPLAKYEEVVAALATKPAETAPYYGYTWEGVKERTAALQGHPTESAGKGPEAVGADLLASLDWERLRSSYRALDPEHQWAFDALRAAETQRSSNATRSDEQTSPSVQPPAPTQAMLDAARDWSAKKYGKPIGDDAARGCWQAMAAAAGVQPPAPEPHTDHPSRHWDRTCPACGAEAGGFWAHREDVANFEPGSDGPLYVAWGRPDDGADWVALAPPSITQRGAAPEPVTNCSRSITEQRGAALIDAYYLPASRPYGDEVKIRRARQIEGPDKWAVVRPAGDCLNKSGEWEWEPMPSSRDDDFLARCRFDSAHEAIDAALALSPEDA